MSGASRIFSFMEEYPEEDQGYVTLVNAKIGQNGEITECQERTGYWTWRHPHQADGTVTYTELRGDITMDHVDFAYMPEKTVLHDITLYAEPGQKIAFVGATGAGWYGQADAGTNCLRYRSPSFHSAELRCHYGA